LAAWFEQHGITQVDMESTGVFWIPAFQILETCGLTVCLVNAQHVNHVLVSDCQWLQDLHSVGLLQPPSGLLRHRANVAADSARHIRFMQKASRR
jgi:hypothetical protein